MVGFSAVGLSACGTVPIPDDTRDTSYAIISEAESSSLLSSEIGLCKVTTVGEAANWKLIYHGDKCTATLNGGPEKPTD